MEVFNVDKKIFFWVVWIVYLSLILWEFSHFLDCEDHIESSHIFSIAKTISRVLIFSRLRRPYREFSHFLDCEDRIESSHIFSIAKNVSKNCDQMIRSMKFLSSEIFLYLDKCTILTCMEHCCNIFFVVPNCYLDNFFKLEKQVCRTVGATLATTCEPMAPDRHVVTLSNFIGIN